VVMSKPTMLQRSAASTTAATTTLHSCQRTTAASLIRVGLRGDPG
jgi:hypothetical protein